jgi:hypothetical protein
MPVSPRPSFNSSPLVRALARLDIGDVPASKQTLAEQLGPWLDWTDAIALAAVLQETRATAPQRRRGAGRAAASAVIEELERVRSELAAAIRDESSLDDPTDAAAYRRSYLACQQVMETRVNPLRARARAALAAVSPSLGRLAALDAVLDTALAARERRLLATVPALVQRRARAEAPAADSSARPAADGRSLQALLLAELATRLQPVEALLEALTESLGRPAAAETPP